MRQHRRWEYVTISSGKCRKILLTAGVLSSSVSSAVMRLREEGLTSEQIAEQLSIKRSAVNANTPYSKGIYNSDFPSANALRIRKHRSKEEIIPQAHMRKNSRQSKPHPAFAGWGFDCLQHLTFLLRKLSLYFQYCFYMLRLFFFAATGGRCSRCEVKCAQEDTQILRRRHAFLHVCNSIRHLFDNQTVYMAPRKYALDYTLNICLYLDRKHQSSLPSPRSVPPSKRDGKKN